MPSSRSANRGTERRTPRPHASPQPGGTHPDAAPRHTRSARRCCRRARTAAPPPPPARRSGSRGPPSARARLSAPAARGLSGAHAPQAANMSARSAALARAVSAWKPSRKPLGVLVRRRLFMTVCISATAPHAFPTRCFMLEEDGADARLRHQPERRVVEAEDVDEAPVLVDAQLVRVLCHHFRIGLEADPALARHG
eukprot:CAMPEP_0195604032 /NCGR_PEP_ID=MMETSP0815-20121206/6434_1 /TAXON_ID=97485 /ORGANISM="Prymnesium parvum, Strain Texoma1" /LENGTH=196 /DNA_ID=CAMNT_0040743677 /DNA_START=338 /DNA_END=923 /DNA_ORIENTATION=-